MKHLEKHSSLFSSIHSFVYLLHHYIDHFFCSSCCLSRIRKTSTNLMTACAIFATYLWYDDVTRRYVHLTDPSANLLHFIPRQTFLYTIIPISCHISPFLLIRLQSSPILLKSELTEKINLAAKNSWKCRFFFVVISKFALNLENNFKIQT